MKLGIKDAKFSGYSFYMNPNIWEHFQVCISVPLRKFEAKYLPNINCQKNINCDENPQILSVALNP